VSSAGTVLERVGEVALPAHAGTGGFDHAAVHGPRARLYVAHTANDALDVIDCVSHAHRGSLPGFPGVAGALVCEEQDLVFTSNRAERAIGMFSGRDEAAVTTVAVGGHPNGLAYDPARRLLLAANVGDPARPGVYTVSLIDADARAMVADLPMPGRTRWAVFDPEAVCFYVNIADPPVIAVIAATRPDGVARAFAMPAAGPHGLELDVAARRLYCACDGRVLVAVDPGSGRLLAQADLAGVPDVIFLDAERGHLYVAVGDPGLIEVFDTRQLRCIDRVPTERGAHTLGFDATRHAVYAFLPETHRALVFRDIG
jgi:DNA-binding beta-propeller fold protein YncE